MRVHAGQRANSISRQTTVGAKKRSLQSRQRYGDRSRNNPSCSEKFRVREGRRNLLPQFGHAIMVSDANQSLPAARDVGVQINVERPYQAFADFGPARKLPAIDFDNRFQTARCRRNEHFVRPEEIVQA